MARPVVVSPAAAEGIDAEAGVHFYVEPNVEAEAARVCDLLGEPQNGLSMGATARAHVIQHYSWKTQLAPLDDVMDYQSLRAEAAE